MSATMPTHGTSSHHHHYDYKLTLRKRSELAQKDLDRTAKIEFFTIHDAFDLQHEENGSQCGTELPHV